MESKTKNRKTRPQIEVMAARAFGGMALADGEDAVTELKEGWFNAAYNLRLADGRETVLKIAPPKGAEVLLYEKNCSVSPVLARLGQRFIFQAAFTVAARRQGGKRDDRGGSQPWVWIGAQAAQRFQAVHVWLLDIQQGKRWRQAVGQFQGLLPVTGCRHPIPQRMQKVGDCNPVQLIIFSQ